MHYDIATKVILSRCKETVLRELCGLPVKSAFLIEDRPQETVSLRRSDFILRCIFEDGEERLVLIEFLSFWEVLAPVRLLEYRCRHLLKDKLPVVSIIFLLTPSSKAVNYYADAEVKYQFRLLKLYEIEAKEILKKGKVCLYPFIPLMKDGEKFLEEAESRIYDAAGYSQKEKADFLTGMAILGGLISKDLSCPPWRAGQVIIHEVNIYLLLDLRGILFLP